MPVMNFAKLELLEQIFNNAERKRKFDMDCNVLYK